MYGRTVYKTTCRVTVRPLYAPRAGLTSCAVTCWCERRGRAGVAGNRLRHFLTPATVSYTSASREVMTRSFLPFHNATGDREEFWGRKLGPDEEFTKAEDKTFLHHAISVTPILTQHFLRMQK